jgi:E3 ubiquitin-protein ligase synoviolin
MASRLVLANFALFNTICFGIVVKTIFFGRLRSIEYEVSTCRLAGRRLACYSGSLLTQQHLFERLWLFLTESLLALTIFRDDFSAPFAVMYGVLLFLKCFHWITADRVDYVGCLIVDSYTAAADPQMDQIPPPGPPTIFHVRCSLIIGLLTLIDCALVIYSLESIVVDGVSAMVLFASEFMILLASIGGTSARYTVGIIDLRRAQGREDAPSWEEKSMYLFYVDLGVGKPQLNMTQTS